MKTKTILGLLLLSNISWASCHMDMDATLNWLNERFPSELKFSEETIISDGLLDLGNKCIEDHELKYLCGLTHINTLILNNDKCDKKLNGSGLKDLDNLKNLTFLDLDYNDIDLTNLADLKNIKDIKLMGNNLSKKDLSELAKLKDLNSLTLADNNLDGDSISQLAGLKVKTLYLGNNSLSDEAFLDFSKLDIETLSLASSIKFADTKVLIGKTFWKEVAKSNISDLLLSQVQAKAAIPSNLVLKKAITLTINNFYTSDYNYENFKPYSNITFKIAGTILRRQEPIARAWVATQKGFSKVDMSEVAPFSSIAELEEITANKTIKELKIPQFLADMLGFEEVNKLASKREDLSILY